MTGEPGGGAGWLGSGGELGFWTAPTLTGEPGGCAVLDGWSRRCRPSWAARPPPEPAAAPWAAWMRLPPTSLLPPPAPPACPPRAAAGAGRAPPPTWTCSTPRRATGGRAASPPRRVCGQQAGRERAGAGRLHREGRPAAPAGVAERRLAAPRCARAARDLCSLGAARASLPSHLPPCPARSPCCAGRRPTRAPPSTSTSGTT